MLGLGSSLYKAGKIGKAIIRDGLVLKHDYNAGAVQPVSTGAANFIASNQCYITTGVGNSLTPLVTGFTASIWVKFDEVAGDDIVFAGSNGDHQRMYIGKSNSSFDFGIGNQSWGAGSNTSTTDWTHLALTATKGGVATFYINGVFDREASFILTNGGGTFGSDFAVGRQGATSDYYTDGYACNVGIWSAALTQPQVKSIMLKDYAALSDSEKTSLVSWWNLDSTMITNPFDGDKFGVLDSHYGGGSELGSEMWDGTNGDTTHWVKFGSNNEISSDDGAVKITYKDDASGYYVYLKNDSHLTADLVVGKFYRLTFSTKINNGSVTWSLKDEDADSWKPDALTSTSFITQQIDFVATATEDHYIYPAFMDGSEEVWIKDISLKLINGNTGTLA